jgi:ATP-binding cassette, subfamily B, bacterial
MNDALRDDDDRPRRFDAATWRRLLRHARPYRPQALWMVILGLVVATADTAIPLVTAALIDEATAGTQADLTPWLASYAVALSAIAFSVWGFIAFGGTISTGVAHDLRRAAFARLQELPFAYFDTRPVGWLVSRLTSDCSKVSNLLPWFLLDLVWGTALLLGISVAMLWLHVGLALVVLAVVPLLVGASLYFQRLMLESSRHIRRENAKITAGFNEAIAGVRTTKTVAREAAALGEFQVLSTAMYRHSMRNALQSAVYLPLVILLGSTGLGLALWYGGLHIDAGVTLGELVAFMQFATLFSVPVQDLARQFTQLQAAQAAAERVQELLDTEPQIADAPSVRRMVSEIAGRGAREGEAIDGGDTRIETIELCDVGFWYKAGEPVLHGCSLRVRAGQTIALVGPTGAGKTTIASLVARFYDVCEGEVLINGVDIRRRSLHWLHTNLGVVLQTPHLFAGTIADNIRYGRLEATDADLRRAAALVHADRFIDALPLGWNTEVGEGGSRLSTGQRQLVALARAILADPQVFVLDEATSSIDAETEHAIQAGIEAALRGRIAFVIAHRLSTIERADQILVVDGGRIVEAGDHRSLLALGGRYAALHREHRLRAEGWGASA